MSVIRRLVGGLGQAYRTSKDNLSLSYAIPSEVIAPFAEAIAFDFAEGKRRGQSV